MDFRIRDRMRALGGLLPFTPRLGLTHRSLSVPLPSLIQLSDASSTAAMYVVSHATAAFRRAFGGPFGDGASAATSSQNARHSPRAPPSLPCSRQPVHRRFLQDSHRPRCRKRIHHRDPLIQVHLRPRLLLPPLGSPMRPRLKRS
ncbi:hypothetical protein OH77DRAFT_1155925 [Trametes cingulata]|nr:hypothetical protein OH77DRAFT_1155925 [Trametes cingulata]